jgi:CRP/FNR family transcriptional regulator
VKKPRKALARGAHTDQRAQVGGIEATANSGIERYRLIPGYRSGDRKIEAGCDLFGVGSPVDAVFNLLDGWVALYALLEDGRKQIVQFALPGAVLGVFPVDGVQSTFGAQALTDLVACAIPHGTLAALIQNDPEISMRMVKSLSSDCSFAYDRLVSIGRRSARERVAHLLLELFIRCRAQWPGHRIEEMYLPLTQGQIGDATGLTHVHVNRVLRVLRRERILEFHYRRLRILDPDKLIEVAGIDQQTAMVWLKQTPKA